MSTDAQFELYGFHQFLSEKIAAGERTLSPEEALDEWRAANRSEAEIAEDVAAIRESLEDLANGDTGVPLAEFDREFRPRHGLTTTP
jgi:hypothetical protein